MFVPDLLKNRTNFKPPAPIVIFRALLNEAPGTIIYIFARIATHCRFLFDAFLLVLTFIGIDRIHSKSKAQANKFENLKKKKLRRINCIPK